MIELLTPDEMSACDRLAIAGGVPGIVLMEKAGRSVADAVARHPLGTRVVAVCGPGNNGGDGFIAARVLAERGYPVQVLLLDAGALRGDGAGRSKPPNLQRSGRRASSSTRCWARGSTGPWTAWRAH